MASAAGWLDRPAIAWGLLTLILVAAGTARFMTLQDWPLWVDEVSTWMASSQHGPIHFLDWTHHWEHPPLSYMLVRASMILMGDQSELTLRLPSFIAGMMCLPALFMLGKVLHSYRLGMAMTLLAAFDPVLVEQARQARMYSLLALMVILLMTAMLILFRRRVVSPWAWIGFGLLLAATYWTHNLGLVAWAAVILATATWAWLESRAGQTQPASSDVSSNATRSVVQGVMIAFTVAVLVSHVGLARLGSRIKHAAAGGESQTGLYVAAVEVAQAYHATFALPLIALVLFALAIYGLCALLRHDRLAGTLGLLLAFAGVVCVIIARLDHHIIRSRYLLLLFVAIFIGVGCAAVLPRLRIVRVSAWAVIVLTCSVQAYVAFDFSMGVHYRQGDMVRMMGQLAAPDDARYYFSPRFRRMGDYYDALPNPPLPKQALDHDYGFFRHVSAEALTPPEAERFWVVLGEVGPEGYPDLLELLDTLTAVFGVEYDGDELIDMLDEVETMLLCIDAEGVTIIE